MQIAVDVRGMDLGITCQRLFDKRVTALQKRLNRYQGSDRQLHVKIEPHRDEHYDLNLELELEGERLHVHKTTVDLAKGLGEAMDALNRQFDKLRIRNNPVLRGRVKRRHRRPIEELLQHVPEATSIAEKEAGQNELLQDLYPSLVALATLELAIYQTRHDIEPGLMTPMELVDEALATSLPTIREEDLSRAQMKRLLHDEMRRTLQTWGREEERHERTDVSTDQDVEEFDQTFMLGDDILDFWVEDEDLTLEDTLPDNRIEDPEQIVANAESRKALWNALLHLPNGDRYAFAAVYMDQETLEDAAKFVLKDVEDVRRSLEASKVKLAHALSSDQREVDTSQVVGLYERLGETFRVDLKRVFEHKGRRRKS